jgi:hypothetical protein
MEQILLNFFIFHQDLLVAERQALKSLNTPGDYIVSGFDYKAVLNEYRCAESAEASQQHGR